MSTIPEAVRTDLAADLRTIRRVAKQLEDKWRDDKRDGRRPKPSKPNVHA